MALPGKRREKREELLEQAAEIGSKSELRQRDIRRLSGFFCDRKGHFSGLLILLIHETIRGRIVSLEPPIRDLAREVCASLPV